MWTRTGTAVVLCLLSAACAESPQQRRTRFMKSAREYAAAKDRSRAAIDFRNAAQAEPNQAAEPLYLAAAQHAELGSYAEAASLLRRALESDPGYTPARLQLAAMQSVAGEGDPAQALAARLDSADGLNTAAFIEIQMERPVEAVKHLEESAKRFPGRVESRLMLAALRLSQKQSDAAVVELEQARKSAASAADLVSIGRLYAMAGRRNEAREMVTRALSADPEYGPALSDRATLQLLDGDRAGAERSYAALSKLRNPRYQPLHALYLASEKRYEEAIAELQALGESNRGSRDFRSLLVSVLTAAGKQRQAMEVLDRALALNPNDVNALLQRANLKLKEGIPAAAEADVMKALRFEHDSAAAHLYLSRVHAARLNGAMRQQELQEALKLDPAFVDARLELADHHLGANQPKGALAVIAAAPAAQQELYRLQVRKVSALMGTGDRAAAATLAAVLRKRLESPMVLLQIAMLQLAGEDVQNGRTTLRALLEMEPENVRALEYLASTYATRSGVDGALDVMRAHAGRYPKSARLRFVLAQWLAGNARFAEARMAYEEARRLDPSAVRIDLALAQLDVAENNTRAALPRIEAVLARDASNTQALFQLGNVQQLLGDHGAAAVQYRKVVDLDPANTFARNNLAYTLAEHLNKPADALPHIQRAKELDPENPEIDDTLGWVMFKMGQRRQAVQYLERSVSRAPTAESRQHLAMARKALE